MHLNVYYVFNSQFSQHFSAAVVAIFKVILLKNSKVQTYLAVSSSLHNIKNFQNLLKLYR